MTFNPYAKPDTAPPATVEPQYENVYIENAALKKRLAEIPPKCGECGHYLTEVRPDQHQCDYCETKIQRDEAWIEIAKLKNALALAHLDSRIPLME